MDLNKWKSVFDVDEAKKQVEEAAKNTFESLPEGSFEAELESIELTESKAGKLMIKTVFKITAGECEGKKAYVYKICNDVRTMGYAVNFLNSLNMFDEPFKFEGIDSLSEFIADIVETKEDFAFELKHTINKSNDNNFDVWTVKQTFER